MSRSKLPAIEPYWLGSDAYGISALGTPAREITDARRDGTLVVLGVIEDADASYSYDDWALCRIGLQYYLCNTSGCSCPSPEETWEVMHGPTTLAGIREEVLEKGNYEGYTLPYKQRAEFEAMLDKAEKELNG